MHNFQPTDRKPSVRPATAKSDEVPVAGTRLCLACGICCQGLLHPRAKLRPEERAQANRHGLRVLEDNELSFALPCPRFAGRCTIYGDRPAVCGSFRCSLLRRLDAGEIDIDSGIAIVDEAKKLIGKAAQASGSYDLAERFQRFFHAFPVDGSASERLALTSLAVFLDRHFVLSRDGYFHRSTTVETERKGTAE